MKHQITSQEKLTDPGSSELPLVLLLQWKKWYIFNPNNNKKKHILTDSNK